MNSAEYTSLQVVVSGRVQGVGYRAFVAREAGALGVTGWVRNAPDGTVHALLQHPHSDVLERLLARLRTGPPASRVNGVEASMAAAAPRHAGFTIQN